MLGQAKRSHAPALDTSELDTLPPHRAAVPLPAVVLAQALTHRRNIFLLSLAAALGLHCGFLIGATLWGQGNGLPPPDPPITVELIDRLPSVPVAANRRDSAPAVPQTAETSTAALSQTAAFSETAPSDNEPAARDDATIREPPGAHLQQTLTGLAKVRRMLASYTQRSVKQAHVTPPLPSRAPRLERATLTGAITTATASTIPIGRFSARAHGSATAAVLAIYKRRVRSQIRHNLPIGGPAPGRLAIGVRLSRSGRLLTAFVLRSSGNPILDRAAVHCVRAAGPYPPPPPGLAPPQLAFSIAFRFE